MPLHSSIVEVVKSRVLLGDEMALSDCTRHNERPRKHECQIRPSGIENHEPSTMSTIVLRRSSWLLYYGSLSGAEQKGQKGKARSTPLPATSNGTILRSGRESAVELTRQARNHDCRDSGRLMCRWLHGVGDLGGVSRDMSKDQLERGYCERRSHPICLHSYR
jgi:hypothetical protein